MLWVDTWKDVDDKLEEALGKLHSDHVPYETKYLKMTRDHDDTIERCKSVLLASTPNKTRKTNDTTIDNNKKDNTLGK